MYDESDIQFMSCLKSSSSDSRIIKEILKHLVGCNSCPTLIFLRVIMGNAATSVERESHIAQYLCF